MSNSKSSRNVSMSGVSTDKLLTFQVIPDVGLKSDKIEFVLGMPLNQVLTMIQKNAMLLKQVELRYSRRDPVHRDVSVYLVSDGIQLIFDGVTQLAKLIEVDNLSRIILKYGNSTFSEPGAEASMEKVNECFGSTHPGAYDEKQKMYVQSWPGLSFCFPTDSNDKIEVTPGFGPNLRSLKYDANSQPRLTKMSIYRGTNLSQPESVDIPFANYCGENRTRRVEAIWENEILMGLDICFDTQNGAIIDGDFDVFTTKRSVYFGDSVSTVQSTLGAPSKIYYKSDDKMKIHRGASKETFGGQPHFFFNYFSMGIHGLLLTVYWWFLHSFFVGPWSEKRVAL
ncbi:unnamed protein product [Caenorhabditis angaria]|uniref:Uncharacterized protein n=1 Tax=Caenorhabditis angaria TaxID=860376 RepID=A0A9P1MVG8_9PELO|nr:unnamed protein product [Caenorhabditis angaria]